MSGSECSLSEFAVSFLFFCDYAAFHCSFCLCGLSLSLGSLESLPRKELEQRLMSSLIMVEALVQQLTAARAQRGVSAGPAPSDLREKLVQTDHTELSQVKKHKTQSVTVKCELIKYYNS